MSPFAPMTTTESVLASDALPRSACRSLRLHGRRRPRRPSNRPPSNPDMCTLSDPLMTRSSGNPMNTHDHDNLTHAVLSFFCTAVLLLGGAVVHATEPVNTQPETDSPPQDEHAGSLQADSTAHADLPSTAPEQPTNTGNLAIDPQGFIDQLTHEQAKAVIASLNILIGEKEMPKVTAKASNPDCFLRESSWASCFTGLPPESEWTMKAASQIHTPKFWQLRSLWTKGPIELID